MGIEMRKCYIIGAAAVTGMDSLPVGEGNFVICADGGVGTASAYGIHPDLVVGDFDSMDENLDPKMYGVEIIRLPKEKDDTDMMFAVKLALERGYRDFVFYGATGGRFDHTVANLQMLAYLCDHGARGVLLDAEQEIFMMEHETCRFPRREGWFFSVFSYTETCCGVSESGVKYPLNRVELSQSFPLGVSNEIQEEYATISVEQGKLLIVRSIMN